MMQSLVRLAGVLACAAPLCAWAQVPSPIVSTQQGMVQGTTTGPVSTWLGLAYAAPPVGALRWYPPQPAAFVSGVRQATSFSSSCPQPVSLFGHASTNEDCLYLNVYAPAGATVFSKLPVLVWIHGGGFADGEGSDYDGSPLVSQDNVVVVTVNYRLGLMGFLAHPALAAGDPNGSSGNYGLQDQQAAVGWVKANISGFGGNPGAVTIFGESAGGASVEYQLTSPGMPALHSAVIESGSYADSIPTLAAAEAAGVATVAPLNCSGTGAALAACLRAVPVATLFSAVNAAAFSPSPNVDGTTLPKQPVQALNSGQFQHVPVISGSNHDEYRLFVSVNDFVGGGPVTASGYVDGVNATFGSAAPAILAAYPVSAYTGAAFPCAVPGDGSACAPNYAFAALVTDYTFACGAHLVDGLISQYAPVYAYELNDRNAPNLLPFDQYLPDPGDAHAFELIYIWPNTGLGAPVTLTPSQQYLSSSMRAYWTSLARYGRPLAPRAGVWQAYGARQAVLSLVPPAPATEYGFVADHHCNLWKPILLNQAGLPSGVPY